MVRDIEHIVPESSSFFQGHVGQYFTKNGLSFKITRNYEDNNALEAINVPKYRHLCWRQIKEYLTVRNQNGGSIPIPSVNDILVQYIKLFSNASEGVSGEFRVHPTIALCTENHCSRYFDLKDGKHCGHDSKSHWDQVTFMAFCDSCGRLIPFHYASNLGKKCQKCGLENGLSILTWKKRDDPASYKVRCTQCSNESGLFLFFCNHDEKKLSRKPPLKFRAVPTRSGTVIHPKVVSIPDIPEKEEINNSSERLYSKLLSEAALLFFPEDVDEALLHLPELKGRLQPDSDFWARPGVSFVCLEKEISASAFASDSDNAKFTRFVRTLLRRAKENIDDKKDSQKIKAMYGIDKIVEYLVQLRKEFAFDENDLQGTYLLLEGSAASKEGKETTDNLLEPRKRTEPRALAVEDYQRWLVGQGLQKIVYIENLHMVQILLGIIEGSTRASPPLFNVISTKQGNQQKPIVFVRKFITEGIVFQLDYRRILKWFYENRQTIDLEMLIPDYNQVTNAEMAYRNLILKDEKARATAKKLLHTFSHMLIQQSTIHTGLDIQSLAEVVYPATASVFIYSTNSINIGGLESTFDFHIKDWLGRVGDLISDCPQDPSCLIDEGGACNACSYIPEFVCSNFNQDLDRSTLIGKSQRFQKGYFDDK